MKNLFTFKLLFLMLIASAVFPQQEKMSYGIFSGVSLNTNSYVFESGDTQLDTSYTNDIKPAFNLGMYVMYDFVKNFGLKLQGQYTNKGGITNVNTFYSTDLTFIERTYRNTLNYLELSLLPQLNLPFKNSNESKAYFNTGGYLAFMLSASEKVENQTMYQYLDTERDISNSLTGTDAGLSFGAGIIYKGFLLDIRYDLGLTNIVDYKDLDEVLNIKNRSINFSIGWTGGF